MQDYRFFNRSAYFTALAADIDSARPGERVIVAAMTVDATEPLVHAIMAALERAAKRGIHTLLLVDAHTFLIGGRGGFGPLFFGQPLAQMRGVFGKTYEALERLKAAGGAYHIANMPERRLQSPFSGRLHIKGATIGDRVYIGGCNLAHPEHIDLMVRWRDSRTAQRFGDLLMGIAATGSSRSTFHDTDNDIPLDDTTRLLIDAGVPGQSLIYEEALQLIDNAKEWLYITCQYFPGGKTAQHLAAAHARGVKVEIVYSHPRVHQLQAPLQHAHIFRSKLSGLPKQFFRGQLHHKAPKLHAKVLASEQASMIGSHNYVSYGVRLGTTEIALKVTGSVFSKQLQLAMQKYLATSTQNIRLRGRNSYG